MNTTTTGILGTDDEERALTRFSELREAAASMVQQANTSAEIVSRDLDPQIYDTEPFVDALRRLITADTRRAQVRILIQQPVAVAQRGSRVLELAQRLPSFIAIHVPGEAHREFNQAMLLVDRTGFIHRDQADRPEAQVCFAAPARANELGRTFDELWEQSVPDQQTRRLRL